MVRWEVILSNNGPHPELKGNMMAVLGKKVMDTLPQDGKRRI